MRTSKDKESTDILCDALAFYNWSRGCYC